MQCWIVSSSRPCVPLGGCRRKVERPNTSMGSSATRPRRLGSTNGASSIKRKSLAIPTAIRKTIRALWSPRKPHKGTALRHGDWPYQLFEFLGQPVPCADDRRGLRTDTGTTVASGSHGSRSGTGVHSTRALLETRSSSGRLSAPDRAAFTSQFPVSRLLSSSGLKLGRSNRLSSPAALPRKFLLVKRPFEVSLFASKSDCEPR